MSKAHPAGKELVQGEDPSVSGADSEHGSPLIAMPLIIHTGSSLGTLPYQGNEH